MTLKVIGLQNGPYKENSSYEDQIEQLSAQFDQALLESPDADLIVFPELMVSPYFCMVDDESYFELAEPLTGKTFQHFSEKAKAHNVHVVITLFEKEAVSEGNRYYNTVILISGEGELVGSYRKTHIPKLVLPTLAIDETRYFERGMEFPVFDVKDYKVGFLICFDRSFPEAARTLALQGADVIIIPTAASGEDRKKTWLAECALRARENGVYVIGINRAGEETLETGTGTSLNFFGLSCAFDPAGNELSVLDSTAWTALEAEIEKEKVEEVRAKMNFLDFLQEDLYHAQSEELLTVRKFTLEREAQPLFRPEGAVTIE